MVSFSPVKIVIKINILYKTNLNTLRSGTAVWGFHAPSGCYHKLQSYFYTEKAHPPSGCYQKLIFKFLCIWDTNTNDCYQKLQFYLFLFRQNAHNIWLLSGIVVSMVQERETKEEAMKHQQSQQQSREAHLAAMADAHKGNISDRNQALRSAANDTGMEALPSGPLDQGVVNKWALYCTILKLYRPSLIYYSDPSQAEVPMHEIESS